MLAQSTVFRSRFLEALTLSAIATVSGLFVAVAAPVVPGTVHLSDPKAAGALLFEELNCAACHAPADATKLNSRTAPRLDRAGNRITPQYLYRFLSDPHDTKSGTTMPDMLSGLSAVERETTVDQLVHYLRSRTDGADAVSAGADSHRIDVGRRLYHSLGCVACHAPNETAVAIHSGGEGGEVPAALREGSVPLGDLAAKTTVAELTRFLSNPHETRPAGRMPSLNLTEGEAFSIASYLLREQLPDPEDGRTGRVPGLRYAYFEIGGRSSLPQNPALIADFVERYPGNLGGGAKDLVLIAEGVAPQPGIDFAERDEQFGLMFRGSIRIPRDGEYVFFTSSDDGSRLYIGDERVVTNDGDHGVVTQSGRITLRSGDHPITITYYENSGGEELRVEWSGPGIRREPVPASQFFHEELLMEPTGAVDFALDPEKAVRGRLAFARLGCASCHEPDSALPPGRSLASLGSLTGGCLASEVPAGLPDYALNSAQRSALRAVLESPAALVGEREPADQLRHALAQSNCYACHERDGTGGTTGERLPYFVAAGEADMGDEGRIPPALTGAGAKLRDEWLREVLATGEKVRPYMATRMPVFGATAVAEIPALLTEIDQPAPTPSNDLEPFPDATKFGRKLVGVTGLSCVACHNFGEYPSLGIPGLSLTDMHRRLRKDWFDRYMVDPPALRPGTRMPSFWPDGTAVNTAVLDGDTQRQLDALWAFLATGSEAAPPDGLIQGAWEIVADTAPTIYRHFIEGAGSRAIGVGYPEKANIAWDANQMRLALAWQGPFIDASKHRSGRGQGYQGPLGHNSVQFPEGAPFARLASPDDPWPAATGRDAGYRMIGYELDSEQRPVFRYEFNGIQVVDFPQPVEGVIDANLRRSLVLTTGTPAIDVWFRAAVGDSIVRRSDGAYVIDDAISLRFPSPDEGVRVRDSANGKELLVPVRFEGGRAEIIQEINW